MTEVTMLGELQGIANCCEHEATEKRLNRLIAQASAAPEQEAAAWACPQQLRALKKAAGSATCAVWNVSGLSRVPLYTRADPSEVERLRAENKRLDLALSQADHNYDCDRQQFEQKLADAQALLRVNRERISTICAHSLTKPAEWCENFKGEIHEGIAKIDAFLSATAQPAEVKS